MNVNLIKTGDEEEFWGTALNEVFFSVQTALKQKSECTIGLAGGQTPERLYKLLSEQALPWEKIKLILVDERHVPFEHSDSNYGMIKRTLLPGCCLLFLFMDPVNR